MSFFEKMKQSASGAAKKAQQTVELTRLKAQISSKEKEIEKTYTLIGEAVFRAHSEGNGKRAEQEVGPYCRHIDELLRDIRMIEGKIKEAKNEKVCRCGRAVGREVNFCSVCGFQFEAQTEPAAAEDAEGEVEALCRICRTPNEADAKFCANCGIAM